MSLIMIVDDSPTEVHVMKTALEKHGFQTMSAADGTECLTLVKEVQPDLIFMDVVMPGLKGFGVPSRLRVPSGEITSSRSPVSNR